MVASYDSAEVASFQNAVASMITQIEARCMGDQKWDEQTFAAVGGSDRAIEDSP